MKTVNDIVWEAIHTGKNAEPWVVHGIKDVAAGATETNPTPSKVDVIGEITTLPYIVPQNSVLVLLYSRVIIEYPADLTLHMKIRITRPGVNNVIHIENEYVYSKEGIKHLTDAWYKENTSISITLSNTATILFTAYFTLYGILVNVSEAFKREK